jgi:histidine triad (HIT) family protein
MKECIFCKIVKSEEGAYKIYEDDDVLAFLDISPVSPGHTLIIPKDHYENIFEIKSEILQKVISAAKMLTEIYMKKLNCTGINLVNANGKDAQQSVFHIHFHLIPRYPNDGIDLWFHRHQLKNKVNIDLDEVFRVLKS